ncbi:MAG: hypothetical protein ACYDDF_02890 [Thermoplasmatota archaeon]
MRFPIASSPPVSTLGGAFVSSNVVRNLIATAPRKVATFAPTHPARDADRYCDPSVFLIASTGIPQKEASLFGEVCQRSDWERAVDTWGAVRYSEGMGWRGDFVDFTFGFDHTGPCGAEWNTSAPCGHETFWLANASTANISGPLEVVGGPFEPGGLRR